MNEDMDQSPATHQQDTSDFSWQQTAVSTFLCSSFQTSSKIPFMRPTIEEEEEVLHTYTVSVQSQVCHRVMVQCCAHRPSKNKTRFRPRGPLDLLGALACGVVSLYARTVAWGGDAADEVLFHSPIGQSSCALASVWILQLFPIPKRILSFRNIIPTLKI